MTIIEYYSAAAIENAVTSLSFKPDKMILIYDNTLPRGQIETDAQRIYNLLYSHSRNFKKIIPVPVNIRAVRETAEVLYNLAEEYKDCTFDLTGGDRLVMVSMGIAYERLRSHNVQMIRYDIVNGAITDYDGDGNIPLLIRPEYISVPESISLYGGQCRWTRVEYTKAFSDNLMELWEINRKNPTKWNNNTSLVSRMRSKSRNESNNPLVITEDYNFSLSKFSAQERGELDSFVKELIRENILVRDQKNGKEIWILFKNDRIKEWFEKTGNVFEMFTYSAVCSILSKDTAGLKNMVLSDAKIYWPEVENLFNEIDVVFMHGYIPVFVSCKNGKIGDSELYKFKIVAERFGGPYAKKILIAAESLEDLMGEGTGIKFRSESFGINVIDGVEKMKTPVELGAKILKILNGK